MRCCCARTQNLNLPITYYPVFGEHNERDHPADSRLARYADPADKAAFPPTCVMPPATSASSI